MGPRPVLLSLALLGLWPAATARAETLRDFCPDRPGLGTPPCTIDSGRFAVELGLADWTLERSPDSRTGTIEAGQLLVRLGLTDSLEAQVGWTAFGACASATGRRERWRALPESAT